jgi:hypothetical protein
MERMHELPRAQIEEFVTPRLEEISDRRRQVENEINDLDQALKSAETPADIMDGLRVGLKLFGLMMLGLKPYQQKELIQGAVAEWSPR